jgi:hypothetical protein
MDLRQLPLTFLVRPKPVFLSVSHAAPEHSFPPFPSSLSGFSEQGCGVVGEGLGEVGGVAAHLQVFVPSAATPTVHSLAQLPALQEITPFGHSSMQGRGLPVGAGAGFEVALGLGA